MNEDQFCIFKTKIKAMKAYQIVSDLLRILEYIKVHGSILDIFMAFEMGTFLSYVPKNQKEVS